MPLLRAELLRGSIVAFAGDTGAIAAACEALGATIRSLDADLLDEEALMAAAVALGPVDTLVCDAASPFAAAGGGLPGLRAGVDGAFNATRAVARAAWIDKRHGKVVLVAPAPGAGTHAAAVRAALENTARTLSVEWARYAITITAILPGDATTNHETSQLGAFLASPAGDYYSGCAFTLGAARP